MTDSLVHEVAVAMWDALQTEGGLAESIGPMSFEEIDDEGKRDWYICARAAIKKIRDAQIAAARFEG
jgi:hypothetical protein